jgi:uncharacterized protein (TIGR03000 family)
MAAVLMLWPATARSAGHGGGGHGGGGHGGGGHGGGGHGGGGHGGHGGGGHGGGGHWGGGHGGHGGHWGGYYGGWGGWGWGGYGLGYGLGWGGGYPGYYGGGYYGYAPAYSSYDMYAPAYGYPGYDYGPAPASEFYGASESAYYDAASRRPTVDNTVVIKIRLPDAEAKVWFEGTPTSLRGTLREFESPQLTPGKDYTYAIRAQWTQNGKTLTQNREIRLQAGDRLTVDFTRPQQISPPPPPSPMRDDTR